MSRHKRPEVDERLARIEGHVRAVRKMLSEGRSYVEITHQVSAVRASLDGVVDAIVEDIVEDCIAKARKRDPVTGMILELKKVVASSR